MHRHVLTRLTLISQRCYVLLLYEKCAARRTLRCISGNGEAEAGYIEERVDLDVIEVIGHRNTRPRQTAVTVRCRYHHNIKIELTCLSILKPTDKQKEQTRQGKGQERPMREGKVQSYRGGLNCGSAPPIGGWYVHEMQNKVIHMGYCSRWLGPVKDMAMAGKRTSLFCQPANHCITRPSTGVPSHFSFRDSYAVTSLASWSLAR